MPISEFEQLAARFQSFESLDNSDTIRINKLMDMAGEYLFNAIERGEIRLANTPNWLLIRPIGHEVAQIRRMKVGDDPADCHDIVTWYYWDMYWWNAVKWISRNIRESLIDAPAPPIGGEEYCRPTRMFDISVVTHRQNQNARRRNATPEEKDWRYVLEASSDACHYLARIHEPQSAKGAIWITANDAERKYGITKSSLSKMASRDPNIRRPATEAEKQQHDNAKIQYMFDARILYERTEGRLSDS